MAFARILNIWSNQCITGEIKQIFGKRNIWNFNPFVKTFLISLLNFNFAYLCTLKYIV